MSGLALAFAVCITLKSHALNPSVDLNQYNLQTWMRQDGLPANAVNAIAQTTDGYIWIGTPAGLIRFDGIRFEETDLKQAPEIRSSNIKCLAISRTGGVWFGLNMNGFGFCDGKSVSFKGKPEWSGLTMNTLALLESKTGDLWVAEQTGAGRLTKDGRFEVLSPPGQTNWMPEVNAVIEDSHGRIWFGTTQGGLFYWTNGILHKFPAPELDQVFVRSILEDHEGRIWAGTQLGLFVYDPELRKPRVQIAFSETRALLVDHHGAVWAGLSGGGLLRYWNGQTSYLTKSNGLADDYVLSLAEDREGSIWFGTRNGLNQLSETKIPTFGATEGLPGDVKVSVSPSSRGGLWVTTSSGITYFDGNKNIESYSTEAGFANVYITHALEAKNRDVYVIDGNKNVAVLHQGKVVANYTNSGWPSALAEDQHGVIAAADGKLIRVTTNQYSAIRLGENGNDSVGYVFNMISDEQGRIWLATASGLLEVINGTVKHWQPENGDPNTALFSIFEDETGVVWAGTAAGIARLKNGQLRYISHQDGVFNDLVYSLVLDDSGDFWAHSDAGIYRVNRKELNDFFEGKTNHVNCASFTDVSAIKSAERNYQCPSGCKTRDGRIWFPTALGIAGIAPGSLFTNAIPPPVHISRVRANGKDWNRDADMTVPPGRGELEFDFTGLSYVSPQHVHFRYRLEGYDSDWVDPGNRRVAFYSNLKPGQYAFQVVAANVDGIWNELGDSVRIKLQPHYYQTAWFNLVCGAAVVALLLAIYAWRFTHLKNKARLLREARDRLEAEVQNRTAQLAEANSSLHSEVEGHKRTGETLQQRTLLLEKEIERSKQMQAEMDRTHQQLLEASRKAGMAEVATSVLHNIGNVLNSATVAAGLLRQRLLSSKSRYVSRTANLLAEHSKDLGEFMTQDPKGQKLPGYLLDLGEQLDRERTDSIQDLVSLEKNVSLIKEIVAAQQSFSKFGGVITTVNIEKIVCDALHLSESATASSGIKVSQSYNTPFPELTIDRHVLLQILINILSNAMAACVALEQSEKRVSIEVETSSSFAKITIADNGVGIAAENLTKIFTHGFTTKKNGHGFGLHASALAAKQLGGQLTASSGGLGQGASFCLELPGKVVVCPGN